LERANKLNGNDYDVMVSLGNVYLDLGRSKNDNDSLEKARKIYSKALGRNPNDINVRTDKGLTYFLVSPGEPENALVEFKKALEINPKHEKTLQFMIGALLSIGKIDEAQKYLSVLKETNPGNRSLAQFERQIAQGSNK